MFQYPMGNGTLIEILIGLGESPRVSIPYGKWNRKDNMATPNTAASFNTLWEMEPFKEYMADHR